MRPTTEVAVYSPSGSLWSLSALHQKSSLPRELGINGERYRFAFFVNGRPPRSILCSMSRHYSEYRNRLSCKPRSRRRSNGSAVLTIDHGSRPHVGVKTCLKILVIVPFILFSLRDSNAGLPRLPPCPLQFGNHWGHFLRELS